MKTVEAAKPVRMDGTFNFRDLGGYPAETGKTVSGRFFRSDALDRLSDADLSWMKEQDITCVIDLRAKAETMQKPDRLQEGFVYHAVSMSDKLFDADGKRILPDCLSDLYCSILETQGKEFAQVMHIMAERKGRPVVFHCAVGKDRTGLTAMFLLSLAGVPEEVIAVDYEPSAQNMKPYFDVMRAQLLKLNVAVPEVMFGSPKEEMLRTLAFIRKKWGSPREYLRQCGVLEEELIELRALLLKP